jgi:hypothetical protein
MYINTAGGVAVTSKDTYTVATITIVSANPADTLTMATEIKGRGNSTWEMDKKSYRLKLSKKTNLLGLAAKEKNWVLLANHADKTLMRNAVAFKVSALVGLEFTPSVRFVDLVFNDEYVDNYLVADQMEIAEHHVPVETQTTTAAAQPEISGGYLLEADGFADSELVWFATDKHMKFTVKYPKDDEINAAQRAYITNFTKILRANYFRPTLPTPSRATVLGWIPPRSSIGTLQANSRATPMPFGAPTSTSTGTSTNFTLVRRGTTILLSITTTAWAMPPKS